MLVVFLILFAGVLRAQEDVVNFVLPAIQKPHADTTFEWRPAIEQSMRMLMVQHAFRVAAQPKTRRELGGSFFGDYFQSVSSVGGWGDGDNVAVNYINHPLQGAVSGYIYLQNDPKARSVEFGATREYWISRIKALAWSAGYSAQFELGPFSEAAIGNVGYKKGTAGYVDFVMTPTGGFAWIIAEDWIDKRFIQRWEAGTDSSTKRSLIRMAMNPSRTLANILRGKHPWHRDDRDLMYGPKEASR
jgi:hypothetical protein